MAREEVLMITMILGLVFDLPVKLFPYPVLYIGSAVIVALEFTAEVYWLATVVL
jgi:hypothetical protein